MFELLHYYNAFCPQVTSQMEAASQADLVFVAVFPEHHSTLVELKPALAGKTLIDVSNGIRINLDGPSNAELLADMFPESSVVKGFNTISAWNLQVGPRDGSRQVGFITPPPRLWSVHRRMEVADFWLYSAGIFVQRQQQRQELSHSALQTNGLRPCRHGLPLLLSGDRKPPPLFVSLVACPGPLHPWPVRHLLPVQLHPWRPPSLSDIWEKSFLQDAHRFGQCHASLCGLGDALTGIPAWFACCLAPALVRHKVQALPWLAGPLAHEEEAVWAVQLPVCHFTRCLQSMSPHEEICPLQTGQYGF